MTTIMTWGNSSGTRGRCDAKCHNAKHDKCKCMCGGKFHGASHHAGGIEQAVKDRWDDAMKIAEQNAQSRGMEIKAKLPIAVV